MVIVYNLKYKNILHVIVLLAKVCWYLELKNNNFYIKLNLHER